MNNKKLTMQNFLDMSVEDLKKISVAEFVQLCSKNGLDFAEVIKNIKLKFDVADEEMQNQQTIYCNMKDNVAVVKDVTDNLTFEEVLDIENQAVKPEIANFIIDCIQYGLSTSKIQRYYKVGFHKGVKVIDKLVYEQIIQKTATNYKVTDKQKFVQNVCSGEILNV